MSGGQSRRGGGVVKGELLGAFSLRAEEVMSARELQVRHLHACQCSATRVDDAEPTVCHLVLGRCLFAASLELQNLLRRSGRHCCLATYPSYRLPFWCTVECTNELWKFDAC